MVDNKVFAYCGAAFIITYVVLVTMNYPGTPTAFVLGGVLFAAIGQFVAQDRSAVFRTAAVAIMYLAGVFFLLSYLTLLPFKG